MFYYEVWLFTPPTCNLDHRSNSPIGISWNARMITPDLLCLYFVIHH